MFDEDNIQSNATKSRLSELRDQLKDINAQLLKIATEGESRALSEDEEQLWDELTIRREIIEPEYTKLEQRALRAEKIRNQTFRQVSGLPSARKASSEYFGMDVRSMDWRTARDGALRMLEDKDLSGTLHPNQGDLLDRRVRSATDTDLARRIIVTQNEHYTSAWHKKMLRGADAILNQEEQLAMLRFEEYRAASEGDRKSVV